MSEPERLLRDARALIAATVLRLDAPARIGNVTLRPEQRDAAARARALAELHGGVVIANDVGTGKTFVALAAAHRCHALVIIAPAVLADRWHDALRRTGIAATVLGVERLARRRPDGVAPDVVIVDESHHLRNPRTKRYDAVAALCRSARVLLLSATPVQNRRDDLAAQLALFLGERARTMSDEERARFVVRRREPPAMRDRAGGHGPGRLPRLDGPHWVRLPDDDLLEPLLALPPPLPPIDGGDGGALLSFALVRRWASSRAALTATLRRRLATAFALEQALEEGRHPTRRELAAWSIGDGAMQLAFPGLAANTSASAGEAAHLLETVRAQRSAIRALMKGVHSSTEADPDRARVDAVRAIRRAHRGEIVLVFSEFAETVNALAPPLAADGGVAWLTSRGARTVAGTVTRREVLAQLAPGGDRGVPAAERVTLLVTTDVSSEGLDLQRASVVVHLDLPWNPARLEQRVGRARRLGATHDRVTVYALAPPAASERLVAVERRLREKVLAASHAVGLDARVLPPLWPGGSPEETMTSPASAAELTGELARLLRGWIVNDFPDTERAPSPLVAAVNAPFRGFLAALAEHGGGVLLANAGEGTSDHPADVLRAACAADAELDGRRAIARAPEAADRDAALRQIAGWWETRRAAADADARTAASAGVRDRAAARVAALLARAPRHLRACIAPLAEAAWQVLASPLPIGSERALEALLATQPDRERWLRTIVGLGRSGAPEAGAEGAGGAGRDECGSPLAPPLRALILLGPDRSETGEGEVRR